MRKNDWIGKRNRKLAIREKKTEPLLRLTIAQLEKKVGELSVRITRGADKVLFMRITNDLNYNIASALLGQLQSERDEYQRQLDSALAWKEGGWEE